MMIDPVTKGPHTYHTTNPVPFIVVDEARRPLRADGALQDIAPTLLGFRHPAAQGNDRPRSPPAIALPRDRVLPRRCFRDRRARCLAFSSWH